MRTAWTVLIRKEELYRICEQENVGITVMRRAMREDFWCKNLSFRRCAYACQCLPLCSDPSGCGKRYGWFRFTRRNISGCTVTATSRKDYASVLASAPQHAYAARTVHYCGHCAPCPAGIDIAMVNNSLLTWHGARSSHSPRPLWGSGSQCLSDCLECSGCEEKMPLLHCLCEWMQKTRELFS